MEEVSDQINAPGALPPGKKSAVPIGQEEGLISKLVWAWW